MSIWVQDGHGGNTCKTSDATHSDNNNYRKYGLLNVDSGRSASGVRRSKVDTDSELILIRRPFSSKYHL